MDLYTFARRVVETEDLEEKLAPPTGPLDDDDPREPMRVERPGRPEILRIVPARKTRVPGMGGLNDPELKPRILHVLANHELQAAELFAWAILAFPDAPAPFRRGLLGILIEEQTHTRLYIERLEAIGGRFGEHPVSGYFWNKIDEMDTPIRFVCAMSLTFENANLDHAVDFAQLAREGEDEETARLFDRIHADEIRHVAFGVRWLEVFKDPGETMWEAWTRNLTWPLRPAKARGRIFHPEGRAAAGLDEDFIRRLEAAPD